jgi:hypothetical protein
MTILGVPTVRPHPTKRCIICLDYVPIDLMTPGSLYADGRQAYACSDHLADRPEWITNWAVFDYEQQRLREITDITEGIQ